jgi:hypothetical protein
VDAIEGELALADLYASRKKFDQADEEYQKVLESRPIAFPFFSKLQIIGSTLTAVNASIPSDRNTGDRRNQIPLINFVQYEPKKQTNERENDHMSTNLTAVLQELLQNTSNLKVLRQLMTPDATYVSLNFDNPELKKVMPWTGTHKGPQALSDVFGAIQRFWKNSRLQGHRHH